MKIEADKVLSEGLSIEHRFEPEEIILDDEHARLTSPADVHLKVRRTGERIKIRGRITASAEVDCDRCLGAVAFPIESEFDAEFEPANQLSEEEGHEIAADELNVATFEDGVIDVNDLVREQIYLAMPARMLCTEECMGLCPVCGANRNVDDACDCNPVEIDPRWEALKNLKSLN